MTDLGIVVGCGFSCSDRDQVAHFDSLGGVLGVEPINTDVLQLELVFIVSSNEDRLLALSGAS